jgi:ketosteroid isomerase-like protein
MSSIAENKAVVAELDAIGNGSGDLSRLDALCASDMVNHALAPGRPQGIEGTRQFLAAARRSEHPGRWTESIVVAEGEMVVQFGRRELRWPGGPFRGFDLAAGICTRDVAFAYRLRDARIVERWAIRDDLAMLQQLGAITQVTAPTSAPASGAARRGAATSRRPRRGPAAPPRAPYGYVVVDGGPHPNPRTAAEGYRLRLFALDDVAADVAADVVRRIFRECLDGRVTGQSRLDWIAMEFPARPREGRNRTGIDGATAGRAARFARFWRIRGTPDSRCSAGGRRWRSSLIQTMPRRDVVRFQRAAPERIVRSRQPAHPAIVSVVDFTRVQLSRRSRSAGGVRRIGKLERVRTGHK